VQHEYNNELTALLVTEGQLRPARDAERAARLATYRAARDSHWTGKVARVAHIFFTLFVCTGIGVFMAMATVAVILGRDYVESPAMPAVWHMGKHVLIASAIGTVLSSGVFLVFGLVADVHARRLVERDGRGPCPWDD
jgi:hypothetical protein